MTSIGPQRVIEALGLPAAALVGQRVPKTLLVEHGAPTAADKRLIESSVEELRWVASLKPNTVGVASFEDGSRQCVELIVLALTIRPDCKPTRLLELVHRAMPYHLLLIVSQLDGPFVLSAADKRWSQGESGRVVLDGDLVATDLTTTASATVEALLGTLMVSRRPQPNLYALYRSWIDGLLAVEAARTTGVFAESGSFELAAERQAALAECADLDKQIKSLRSAAAKERQMARQVDLNLQLRQLQTRYDEARKRL